MRGPGERLLALVLVFGGCRSEPDIRAYDSSLLGLYTIEAWTVNEGSCASEGPSVLAARSERRALVQACTRPHEGLHVVPCDDVQTCEAEACDANLFAIYPDGWDRLAGDDEEGWRGKSWQKPAQVGDRCEAVLRDVSVTVDGEGLVLRSRVAAAVSFPIDERGHCFVTEEAQAAALKLPCAKLEVLRIRRDNADCDPLDAGSCAADELCAPYGRRFVCTPSVSAGQYGDPCDFESCAPGLLCVAPHWVPGCTTPGCCTHYCDGSATDAKAECAGVDAGLLCHPFYFEDSEQPGREDVGVCGLGFDCGDQVIPRDWVCDGSEDCENEADELDCDG